MRTGSDAIAPSSAARCEIDLSGGAATVPRRRVAGCDVAGPSSTTGKPSSPMSVVARSAWSAAHQSVTVPCVASQEGARDMSEMLIPARPERKRDLGDDARAVRAPRRAARAARTPTARSSSSARRSRGDRLLPGAQVAAVAQLVARARRAARSPRRAASASAVAVRGVDAGPQPRVRAGDPRRVAEAAADRRRAALELARREVDEEVRDDVRQVRDDAHPPVVDRRARSPRAARRTPRRAGAGARRACPSVRAVGVRYQTAPSKRSPRACATPAASAPASGWPPTKRGSPPAASTTGAFTDPTSLTTQSGPAARSASAHDARRGRRRAPPRTRRPHRRERRRASARPRRRPRARARRGPTSGSGSQPTTCAPARSRAAMPDGPADQPEPEDRDAHRGPARRRRCRTLPATAAACSTRAA